MTMDRRTFLQTTAGLVGGAVAGSAPGRAAFGAETRRYAIWSLDVEDNHYFFYEQGQFVERCRQLHELLAALTGGAVTWYLKVDFVSDVTDHDGMDALVEQIQADGGEIGIHCHHFSAEPYWRRRQYVRALRSLKEHLGVAPTSYSSGNGNDIAEDTRILMDLGFANGRLVYPGRNLTSHATFDAPYYYGLAGSDLTAYATPRAGYLDPEDYRRHTETPTMLNFPEAYLHVEGDTTFRPERQLKLGDFAKNDVEPIVTYSKANTRFCHAWTHPHNMMVGDGAHLVDERIDAITHLARMLKAEGYRFVTCAQAQVAFEQYGELTGD